MARPRQPLGMRTKTARGFDRTTKSNDIGGVLTGHGHTMAQHLVGLSGRGVICARNSETVVGFSGVVARHVPDHAIKWRGGVIPGKFDGVVRHSEPPTNEKTPEPIRIWVRGLTPARGAIHGTLSVYRPTQRALKETWFYCPHAGVGSAGY